MFKTALKSTIVAALLAGAAAVANADPIVFDRGLPTTNLNNAAGANRSNVSWGFGENSPAYYSGDDFKLGAGQWNISTLRVWATVGPTSDISGTLLADRYSSISLYGGSGSTLTNLMSGTTVGNSTNNANITITKVKYAGGADYDSFGTDLNIFEIDFNNLNWIVDGSVSQYFSVAGVDNANDQTFRPFFMHGSNAGKGGVPADGADGQFAAFFDNGSGGLNFDGFIDSSLPGNGWDKSSDINVQVEASAVPEPASFALFGVALAGLAATRRKRAAKR